MNLDKLNAIAKPRSEEAISKAEDRKLEREHIMKCFFRQCAISFINYLDSNRYEGKMDVSNMECEDIESAFLNADWAKLHRYYNKYIKE